MSETDFKLVIKKVAAELQCAKIDYQLMKAWEKRTGYKWISRVQLRKRRIEATRLAHLVDLIAP